MLSGSTGIIHFAVAILSLIFGTLILYKNKGTISHKRIGYAYTVCMLILLVTSFMIQNLASFGILHWLALLSSVTLIFGMIPVITKFPKRNYLSFHMSFMYWSVIGLYCAFAAEIFTRIPFMFDFGKDTMNVFYMLLGVSTALVGGMGSFYFKRYKKVWEKKFGSTKN